MINSVLTGLTLQADTLLLRTAPVGLERWAAMSVIAIAAFLLLVIIALLFALLELRKLTRKITEAVGRIEPNVHPVLERARGVTENVEHITGLVRKDVDRVTDSVEAVTGRLNQAAEHMEERINEFNALVEVVQMEAEGVFLDTASTVHGVRAGAISLGSLGGGTDFVRPTAADAGEASATVEAADGPLSPDESDDSSGPDDPAGPGDPDSGTPPASGPQEGMKADA